MWKLRVWMGISMSFFDEILTDVFTKFESEDLEMED
jgi:hypothetical protein